MNLHTICYFVEGEHVTEDLFLGGEDAAEAHARKHASELALEHAERAASVDYHVRPVDAVRSAAGEPQTLLDTRFRVREVFATPHPQHANRRGQPFELLRAITKPDETHDGEALPMYVIRFADGCEIDAWPDEVLQDLDERVAHEAGPPPLAVCDADGNALTDFRPATLGEAIEAASTLALWIWPGHEVASVKRGTVVLATVERVYPAQTLAPFIGKLPRLASAARGLGQVYVPRVTYTEAGLAELLRGGAS